jgi:hypothetical protein
VTKFGSAEWCKVLPRDIAICYPAIWGYESLITPARGHRRLINCTGECRAVGVKCCARSNRMQRRDLASFFHDLQKYSQCWNPLCGLRKESTGSWLGRQRNLVVLQQLRIQGLINSRRQISGGRPSCPNVGDYRGHLAPEFSPDTEMLLGKRYQARIREKKHYNLFNRKS